MTTSVEGHEASERLEIEAEIQRLARLLELDPVELDYLRDLSSPELRGLRGQVVARLFDSQGGLANLAAATKVLPVGLTATLAEKVFGPLLTARIAGLVEAGRAVDVASRLPIPFLAAVATELDPRRVAAILVAIPPETIAAVTRELVRREEWLAMGAFYGYLPPASIRAALDEADPHALLQISLVLDDKTRLATVLEIAGMAKLEEIAVAAEAEGLSEQLRALAIYLTPEQRTQLPV